MEAKELRIGNLIQDKRHKSTWRIECFLGQTMATVDAGMVNFATDDLHDIELSEHEPIVLDEKWLIKFGFVDGKKNMIKLIRINEFYFVCFVNGSKSLNVDLKFVHQLQNLYYALTGVELSVSD
jgi:hypothetical protein